VSDDSVIETVLVEDGVRGTGDPDGVIVGAALVAHVPTIVLPEATRRELNEGREISLVPGLHRLRAEVLDRLEIDTIVVFDAHWFTTVEFVVAAHARRHGHYTSEELPRGMCQVPYDIPGDPDLASAYAAAAADRHDMWVTAIDDPYLPIHYPTVNLLGFLQRDERWMSVSNCQTAERDDYLLAGELLADAVRSTGRRVFLVASGAMSHTFHRFQDLRRHEASDPSHIISDAARGWDRRILDWWAVGDHASVIDAYDDYRAVKPEGRFGHYLCMVGALGGRECRAVGVPFSDYENSIGTAQIHVNFEL
jgi:aromatic ring-opening dioxygenase catalytic subunit (LigB family)